jgi:hypothetical protein
LAVLTTVVVSGALWFLWFGGPMLNPPGTDPKLRGRLILNADTHIVLPVPKGSVSPRDGVIQPDPADSAPPTASPVVFRR